MNPSVESIVRAVLYEGYILYPYRASATKNRHPWSPGGLMPVMRNSPPSALRAECLALSGEASTLSVCVRFLHLLSRTDRAGPPVREATERKIELPAIPLGTLPARQRIAFDFPPSLEFEGDVERLQHAIEGAIEVSVTDVGQRVNRVSVVVTNLTLSEVGSDRDGDAMRTFVSAHVVLGIQDGEFVSLTDPPPELRAAADACHNEGVWPVLVGEPGNRDTVLASPIILPDYPQIATESLGDFFDGTEIDEMLTLRVLTLTDDEKREMAADPHTRLVLERVETLASSALAQLHGTTCSRRDVPAPGDRVRLRPRGRADAIDVFLAGKTATVVSVETDFGGTVYFAVKVDDDPGHDLGDAGRPGHRFFYRAEEIERLTDGGQK